MTEPLLHIESLRTGYGDTSVLHGIGMQLAPGESLALLGRNGVGKSTLMMSIMGLTTRHGGSLRFKGRDITGLKTELRARSGIGFVPQERQIFKSLTVEENLKVAAMPGRPGHWSLDAVYALFPRLHERRANLGDLLSGGEKGLAAIALLLSIAYYFIIRRMGALKYTDGFAGIFSGIVIVACFTAGAQFVTWMGNQIDAKGIGNGLSLMIFAGIVADWSRVGSSFQDMLTRAQAGASGYYIMIPAMVILALVAVVFVVILTNAERRIPVQYAKRVVGRKMYGGQASYIPIKVNMSGVMPIIFASTLCGLPNMIGSFLNLDATKHPYWTAFFRVFNYNSVLYLVVYVLLIVAFNYFYVAIQYNPVDISNQLRKNNGTIPGIRPGKPTSDFITKTLSKITLIGAVFLAIVAAVPMIIGDLTGVSIQLGGTSLLIIVGVALDTARSLEGYMTARHHKGFLE